MDNQLRDNCVFEDVQNYVSSCDLAIIQIVLPWFEQSILAPTKLDVIDRVHLYEFLLSMLGDGLLKSGEQLGDV